MNKFSLTLKYSVFRPAILNKTDILMLLLLRNKTWALGEITWVIQEHLTQGKTSHFSIWCARKLCPKGHCLAWQDLPTWQGKACRVMPNSDPRDRSVYGKACPVMPNSDPRDRSVYGKAFQVMPKVTRGTDLSMARLAK